MAFNLQNFNLATDGFAGGALRIYTYISDDLEPDVTATGYFSGVGVVGDSNRGVRVGDVIIVASLTTGESYTVSVSAVDENGNVTAAASSDDRVRYDVLQGLTSQQKTRARANIGAVIGTDVQAYSANLSEYAAVNPTPAGLALLDDADADAQRTTMGVTTGEVLARPMVITSDSPTWAITAKTRMEQTVNLGDDAGLAGDDVADDAAAVARMIAVAYARGKRRLVVPRAPVAFRLGGRIDLTQPLLIEGDGVSIDGTTNVMSGSAFHVDHSDEGFRFRTATGGDTKFGAKVAGIGIRRNQPTPGVGWAPAANSADIRVEYGVELDDVMLQNPTIGVLVRNFGVLHTRRLRGQPLSIGVQYERSADVNRHHETHFWPYWTQDANVVAYTIANAVGFEVARCDGFEATGAPFGIFYKWLFRFVPGSSSGSGVTVFNLISPYADGGGGLLEVISDHFECYGNIIAGQQNSDPAVRVNGIAGIRIAGAVPSTIGIFGYRCNRASREALLVEGAAHRVLLAPTMIKGWDRDGVSAKAFQANNGAVISFLNRPVQDVTAISYGETSGGRIELPFTSATASGPLTSATGFNSRRMTLASNTAQSFALVGSSKVMRIEVCAESPASASVPGGEVWVRASGSPAAQVMNNVVAGVTTPLAVSTGVLNGSTGAVGAVTISPDSSGVVYVENRTTGSLTLILTLKGN